MKRFKCHRCKQYKLCHLFNKDNSRKMRGCTYECIFCKSNRVNVGWKRRAPFISKEDIEEFYFQKGLSQAVIGKKFNVSQSHIMNLMRKYKLHTKKRQLLRDKKFRKRMDHGYVLIYRPNHFRKKRLGRKKGFIKEHIYLAETKILRRVLKKGEVVHHINGKKSDNDLKNLFPCTNKKHLKLHSQLQNIAFQLVRQGKIIFRSGEYEEKK